ncbi:MAG TPA: hypothetical protein VK956_13865, partial [Verrucomicrobium sp.]|nr:hypothetical protein [Verrucomicrobium sp.]
MIHFQFRLVLLLVPFLCLISSWADAAKPNAFVFRPTNGTGPFPVAVWLHGYRGYSKEGYVRGGDKAL